MGGDGDPNQNWQVTTGRLMRTGFVPCSQDVFFAARPGSRLAIARDWSQPYQRNPALIPVFKAIYDAPHEHWDAYNMCEKLVDVEENFLLWRFRHVKTASSATNAAPGGPQASRS